MTGAGQTELGPEAAETRTSLAEAHAAEAAAFREEAGHLTASLVRSLGDFDLAEESLQEAVVQALEHWPREGIPKRPGAWLLTGWPASSTATTSTTPPAVSCSRRWAATSRRGRPGSRRTT